MKSITNFIVASLIAFVGIWIYQSCSVLPKPVLIVSQPKVILTHPLQEQADKIVALLKQNADDAGCPGFAVAIIADSTILSLEGHGFSNTQSHQKIDVNTVFRLGSVSKTFAGVLSSIMVQDGKLNWEDPVTKHLPDFMLWSKEHGEKLTIHNILSQGTGLPPHTYTNLAEEGYTMKEILPKFRYVKSFADTGKLCTYQNVAFGMIEPILDSITGHSYSNLLFERVLQPLGMTATTSCDGFTGAGNRCEPHKFNWQTKQYTPVPVNEKYYNIPSAGGVNASISDMSKYMFMLVGNRPDILQAKSIRTIFTPVVSGGYEYRYFDRWPKLQANYYGIGWRVLDYDNELWAYHGGYVNGFRSEIAIHPTKKIGVCILFNSACSYTSSAMKDVFDQLSCINEEHYSMQ